MELVIIIIIISIIMAHLNKNICVVGAGKWGKNHISTLNKINCLRGIVEQSINVRNTFKKKYPNVKIFQNIQDAINFGFDGFIVATPAETHYNIAKKIIESKNHVLVEKPITTTYSDAKELNNLAKNNKVNLMVGHLLLFHPAIIKIKSLIDNGKIGKLQYIYSNRLNLGTIRSEENVFWSFAPHDISLLQYFIQDFPLNIVSNGGAFIQKDIHDTTMSFFEYPNNIRAHIYVSWLHPFKEHRLVIIGSEGMISYEDSDTDKDIKFYDKKYILNDEIPVKKDGHSTIINYKKDLPLENELKYFISHLNDDFIDIANGDAAVEVVKILEEATKSLIDTEVHNEK